jgi:ubiquinone/menaquinone biosynthesis C-methylase UbiE
MIIETTELQNQNPRDPLALRTTGDGAQSDMGPNLKLLVRRGVIDPYTGEILPNTRIIEFGSGMGGMTLELAARGAEIVGVEINPDCVRQAQAQADYLGLRTARFVQADAQKLVGFADGSMDIALSFDNLEHLPDLDQHLREVNRILVPGGRFIFETPNIFFDPFYQLSRQENGRRVHTWRTYREAHCSTQSYWFLINKLKVAGFEAINFERMPFYDDVFKDKVRKTPFEILLPIADRLPWDRIPPYLSPMFYGAAQKPV